jgi:hypothetical protein
MNIGARKQRGEAPALRIEGGRPGGVVFDDLHTHVAQPDARKILGCGAATVCGSHLPVVSHRGLASVARRLRGVGRATVSRRTSRPRSGAGSRSGDLRSWRSRSTDPGASPSERSGSPVLRPPCARASACSTSSGSGTRRWTAEGSGYAAVVWNSKVVASASKRPLALFLPGYLLKTVVLLLGTRKSRVLSVRANRVEVPICRGFGFWLRWAGVEGGRGVSHGFGAEIGGFCRCERGFYRPLAGFRAPLELGACALS